MKRQGENSSLTTTSFLRYSKNVLSLRAVSGLRRNAERSVLVLGHIQPECSPNREAGTALKRRNNTRAFLLPKNVQNLRRYHHV
jgi:hypothetical protein